MRGMLQMGVVRNNADKDFPGNTWSWFMATIAKDAPIPVGHNSRGCKNEDSAFKGPQAYAIWEENRMSRKFGDPLWFGDKRQTPFTRARFSSRR